MERFGEGVKKMMDHSKHHVLGGNQENVTQMKNPSVRADTGLGLSQATLPTSFAPFCGQFVV